MHLHQCSRGPKLGIRQHVPVGLSSCEKKQKREVRTASVPPMICADPEARFVYSLGSRTSNQNVSIVAAIWKGNQLERYC